MECHIFKSLFSCENNKLQASDVLNTANYHGFRECYSSSIPRFCIPIDFRIDDTSIHPTIWLMHPSAVSKIWVAISRFPLMGPIPLGFPDDEHVAICPFPFSTRSLKLIYFQLTINHWKHTFVALFCSSTFASAITPGEARNNALHSELLDTSFN